MSDASLLYSDEPLEPWESEQSRWESRDAWRPGSGRPPIHADLSNAGIRALPYEIDDIQQLATIAAKQLAEALAVRRASLRQIAELEEQIKALRAALHEETHGTGVRPSWVPGVKREIAALCDSENLEETVFDHAVRFSCLLSSWVPEPEIGADPDGQIFFEWQHSARWVFTASVSPEGLVYYAGLFGTSRNHGVDEITHVLPPSIRANLARFVAGAS